MERIIYRISLDTHRGGIQKTLQGFLVGDAMSRSLEISMVARGESMLLGEDVVAMMYVTKEGASEPSVNACTIEDNKVIYNLLQEDLDTAGMVTMQLKLLTQNVIVYAPVFALEVGHSNAGDEGAMASPTFTALEKAVLDAQTAYNTRITGIEIDEELIFHAYFADGTEYQSDAFANLGEQEEARQLAEQERVLAEEGRVTAEEARVIAEEARVVADAQRMANVEQAIADVRSVIGETGTVTISDRERWDKAYEDTPAMVYLTNAEYAERLALYNENAEYVDPDSGKLFVDTTYCTTDD